MSTLPAAEPDDDADDVADAADDDPAGDRGRAAAVLAAVAEPARRRGLVLRDLALWRLATSQGAPDPAEGPLVRLSGERAPGDPERDPAAAAHDTGPPPDEDPAGLVGAALEQATDAGHRRVHGLHVTPAWLARDLAARALPPGPAGATAARSGPGTSGPSDPTGPTVCDPACGGGAFLVAAARLLHERGHDRRHVVRHLVWGADIDPVGLAAAEAALALWAGEPPPPGRLVVADALRVGPGAWPDRPARGFTAVVGNPPFQNQLARDTARTGHARRALRDRYGGAVRAYTDSAWLFLLLGLDLVVPGGRVVLVEPQSVIGARDAEAVRQAVAARGDLRDLWLDDDRVFSAAVRVCAPVVQRRASHRPDEGRADGGGPADGPAGAGAWRAAWARAAALPAVAVEGEHGTVGDRAAVVAGFRDQYYGLADAVRERDELAPGTRPAPLVTSGAVDWAGCTWGIRPTRYAKRRWRAPVIDPGLLAAAPRIARRWVERTAAPKLVVATQTRVIEAAVDVTGAWVPSVPALAVVPHDPDDLWLLAAAVLSPAASLWIAHRSGGTALDRGALKLAGPDLAALPLPSDRRAWRDAAAALRAHVATPTAAGLDRYLRAGERAYGTAPVVTGWWRTRAGAVAPAG